MISLLYCVCVLIVSVGSESNTPNQGDFQTRIEGIVRDLSSQKWDKEEKPCFVGLINILRGVNNQTLWASWVWDSMQTPSGVLYGSKFQPGNFDECIDTPWMTSHPELRTQYCLAEVKLSNKEAGGILQEPYSSLRQYINTQNEVKFNSMTWGICVPESCHPRSSAKFVKSMLRSSYLEFALPETSLSVNFCQNANDVPFTITFYCFIFFLAVTLIAILISTVYLLLHNTTSKSTICLEVAESLSIFKNASELSRVRADETRSINGMRCISSFLIVCLHMYFISNFIGFTNGLYYKKAIEHYKVHLLLHGEVVVDTFFVLSGLLLMKSFFASQSFSPGKIIAKRYFRLVYLMAVIIFGTIAITDYIIGGPLQPDVIKRIIATCQKNWWLNLLMISNYIDVKNMCYPVTWSIFCDFHLTVLGTMLFWLYLKHRHVAVISYLVVTVASIVLPALATYNGLLSPVMDLNIETHRSERQNLIEDPRYINTHYRAAPYLIGFGYAFLIKKCNIEPNSKIFSKTVSMAGILVASMMCLAIVMISGAFYLREYNVVEATLFAGVSRTVWALAICLLIAVAEYGDAPLFSNFLQSSVFVPFSKLSYGLYLIHTNVIGRKLFSNRNPIQIDFFVTILDAIGVTVISYCISFVSWLLFEAPMNNIVALILRTKTTERSQNVTKKKQ